MDKIKGILLGAMAWTVAAATATLTIIGAWSVPRVAGFFLGVESFLLAGLLFVLAREARRLCATERPKS